MFISFIRASLGCIKKTTQHRQQTAQSTDCRQPACELLACLITGAYPPPISRKVLLPVVLFSFKVSLSIVFDYSIVTDTKAYINRMTIGKPDALRPVILLVYKKTKPLKPAKKIARLTASCALECACLDVPVAKTHLLPLFAANAG